MKKVYVSFNFVYVELNVDTTLDNKIYSSSIEDKQFFVMNQDVSLKEFRKQETYFLEEICQFDVTKSCKHSNDDQDKYNECVLSLISEIRKLEKSTDDYSVYDLI